VSKVWDLERYADAGALHEVEDAEFLRRKVGPEDLVDFTGIASVTADFLTALFLERDKDHVRSLIRGAEGAVSSALGVWLGGAPPADPEPTPPLAPTAAFSAPEQAAGRYTPTRLVARLRGQLSSYIESAYPLKDPVLIQARSELLQNADAGRLISQEPFIETTPRYKQSAKGFDALGLAPKTGEFLTRMSKTPQDHDPKETLLYPGLYVHQAEALSGFLAKGKDLIVATGTGSGKTECFLIPLLGKLHQEAVSKPKAWEKRAVRCLILYPMNALVNDQLARLRLLFGSQALSSTFRSEGGDGCRHPMFGMYTGRTPYPGPKKTARDSSRVKPLLEYYLQDLGPDLKQRFKQLGRYPAKDLEAFLSADKAEQKQNRSGKAYTKHNWDKRLLTGPDDRELLTRQEMVEGPYGPPDILVTNYSMLEYMLMRPFERPIFDHTRAWLQEPGSEFLLVLDEAHMYRGSKGAEVAFLIRRLLARLGITDSPEKLRVICTSASLGGEESTAVQQAFRFAADLTGKSPDDFIGVTGEQAIPEDCAPGPTDLAEALSQVDLDRLHNAEGATALAEALAPIQEALGLGSSHESEADLVAELHGALTGRSYVNLVLKRTAGHAIALEQLAQEIFPNSATARLATEVLLSLGAIAKAHPNKPSLFPARLHLFFRGLNALYACLNPTCPGRQAAPGERAPVGKLFVEGRTRCEDCGSRVLELASCRQCGGAYLIAYSPVDRGIDRFDFLWGETEGALEPVYLLPEEPREQGGVEEILVQLKTGFVDREANLPPEEVRSLYLSLTTNGERQPTFERCPLCQPPGSRRSTKTLSFTTRGEPPFTALLEAQLAEQPPQNKDPSLPNAGRKVLVFSDGRQKAARLAPALEHSHARDAFRQVLALAATALEKEEGVARLNALYPASVWVCQDRGVDLFPSADEEIFHSHITRARGATLKEVLQRSYKGSFKPTASFARQLYSELTDRFFSMAGLGLATVQEDPIETDFRLADFPEVGLSSDEVRIVFRGWIRAQLESRRFLPEGARYIELGDEWQRPEGIELNNRRRIVPARYEDYLAAVLESQEAVDRVAGWFAEYVRGGLLRQEGDRYYLSLDGFVLKLQLDAGWYRCASCSRLHAESLQDKCTECLGRLVPAEQSYMKARTGYYQAQLARAFDPDVPLEPFGLSAAEHSAQLGSADAEQAFSRTEEYELRFQDVRIGSKPPIDVLSCTTTMEVGIDIGSLSAVALRNVPPHVANYQQRAGRAGRRGRTIASVVTYAAGDLHDAYFYDKPAKIISGDVRPPVVYIENQKVLERHINAFLIQHFFHDTVSEPADDKAFYRLFQAMGTVEKFLDPSEPCSHAALSQWLEANSPKLQATLKSWVPHYSHCLQEKIDQKKAVTEAIPRLLRALNAELPIAQFQRRDELNTRELEALERQLPESLLQTLIDRAVFPRYAFPTDTVTFYVPKKKRRGDPTWKREFEYTTQRGLQIALSEFAPGREITIDKLRFRSAGLYSPFEPDLEPVLEKAKNYASCPSCGMVSLELASEELTVCPGCGADGLLNKPFITPIGFTTDVNAPRQIDRGGSIAYAGRAGQARLEIQRRIDEWTREACGGRMKLLARPWSLVTVNKGIGDRGFRICPACGLAEPEYGPGFTRPKLVDKAGKPKTHVSPVKEEARCSEVSSGPYYLGHSFITDVLLLRLHLDAPMACSIADRPEQSGRAGRSALTSLAEALCLAASRALQIEKGELAGGWNPVIGGGRQTLDLYLYDLLPGGAGYTRMVLGSLEEVLKETEDLLSSCSCPSSCYRCLRHYGNRFLHRSLDRKLALALLRHVRHGTVPSLDSAAKRETVAPLVELLRLKRVRCDVSPKRDGVEIPLIAYAKDGSEVWVDVHHPLVDSEEVDSPVRNTAESSMLPVVSLGTHAVAHDLPWAYARLELE
jgi:ATP-dependent helicase YprA (DUF1998 family)